MGEVYPKIRKNYCHLEIYGSIAVMKRARLKKCVLEVGSVLDNKSYKGVGLGALALVLLIILLLALYHFMGIRTAPAPTATLAEKPQALPGVSEAPVGTFAPGGPDGASTGTTPGPAWERGCQP